MSEIRNVCASCGTPLAAPEQRCPDCGTAMPGHPRSLFRVVTGVAATPVQEQRDDASEVILSSRDFMLLETLVSLQLPAEDAIAQRLRQKLARSRVVAPTSLPPGLVTLGSRVVFSVEGAPVESRVLVLPDGPSLYGWSLPVTTPRGLAMLGARAGTTVLADRRDGGIERIAIHTAACPSRHDVRQAGRPDAVAPGFAQGVPVTRRGLISVNDTDNEDPEPPAA